MEDRIKQIKKFFDCSYNDNPWIVASRYFFAFLALKDITKFTAKTIKFIFTNILLNRSSKSLQTNYLQSYILNKKSWCCIIGATSETGQAYANYLSNLGFNLILVAKN